MKKSQLHLLLSSVFPRLSRVSTLGPSPLEPETTAGSKRDAARQSATGFHAVDARLEATKGKAGPRGGPRGCRH